MHQWFLSYQGQQMGPLDQAAAVAQATRDPSGHSPAALTRSRSFSPALTARRNAGLGPVVSANVEWSRTSRNSRRTSYATIASDPRLAAMVPAAVASNK